MQKNLRHKNVDLQCKSIEEIFVTVLILYPTLIFLAFRAYLLEPLPQDYITKGKTMKKSQNSNEVKNGCTRSRIRIVQDETLFWTDSFVSSLMTHALQGHKLNCLFFHQIVYFFQKD